MQRNFDPMRKQVEAWQKGELTDVTAKVVIPVCRLTFSGSIFPAQSLKFTASPVS
jgi:hypothetical protein